MCFSTKDVALKNFLANLASELSLSFLLDEGLSGLA